MVLRKIWKRYDNHILASGLLLIILLIAGIRYDYYYDLNDDVLMKDILAGVYTGTPEGHNIQMLYPLSLGISLLYRILPKAPVYGIFLCVCQYISLWLFARRSLDFHKSLPVRLGILALEGIAVVSLLLPHLVFVQYTFTTAMMAGAAAFLLITAESMPMGSFIRKNIPAVVLTVLAYMLRTEMLLLLFPLLCVAGLYHWSMEKKILQKENFYKYFGVLGMMLAGMVIASGIHASAFAGEDWKEYVAFFDSRTEVYDFQGIPAYEGNEELYQELELMETERDMLLDRYNFGLDENLDAEAMEKIAAYQKEHKAKEQSFFSLFVTKAKQYVYRIFHKELPGSAAEDDYPWNVMMILGYLAVLFVMLLGQVKGAERSKKQLIIGTGKLMFLFFIRTGLWMFILMRGRDPVRITHSLYLTELWILAGMLLAESRKLALKAPECMKVMVIVPVVFGLVLAGALGNTVKETDEEYRCREAANVVDMGMKEYCRRNPEHFYFFDVYSAVSYPVEPYMGTPYSEKMFVNVDNRIGNYDIMGGWLVKSPSYQEKLKAFGMESMSEGLLYGENVYMMAELAKGTDDIATYFAEQGVTVEVSLQEQICDLIGVYAIEPVGAR